MTDDIQAQMRALIDANRTRVETLVAEHEIDPVDVDPEITTVVDDSVYVALAAELTDVRGQIKSLTDRETALKELITGGFGDKEVLVAAGRKIGTFKTQHRVDVNTAFVKENFPHSAFPDAYTESDRRVFLLDPSFKGA